ncbi:unnamed protein product [Soboliphyme baturini]|uniref:DUF2062 domain-containing protein n=1 Tax=Soboliphyme baturini TaxID=241478 RepID=A0A183J9V9_9BILA|nr:unnamed protein product [Soboliphyme baturini]
MLNMLLRQCQPRALHQVWRAVRSRLRFAHRLRPQRQRSDHRQRPD